MLDAETCHGACEAKDRRFDGRFFVGVSSTGIYCRCICPARTPKRANRSFWPSAAAAEAAGFRPCLICRPERAPGLAPIDAPARLAAAAYARIEAGALEEAGLEALAGELGVTSRHLRRVMNAQFGASPIEIAQTGRLLAARRLLNETALPVTEIAFASGFRSLRRFNHTMKARYGAPPSKMRGRKILARGETFTVSLSPRGDYAFAPMLEFLSMRALAGVELGGGKAYARTLRWGDAKGWIEIGYGAKGLLLTLSENLAPHLRPLVANVRGAFDLDAEMTSVDAHLAADAEFKADVKREPGVRVPGAIDGFETAIRAVLGQQVTVAGARTLTERLVIAFGAPLEGGPEGLTHHFPSAGALADAGATAIAKIGLPKKRAETLHALALASVEGRLPLARGAIAAGRAALAHIPGIGPWTIEYVAMRALGDPDAYPATDIALISALGRKGEMLTHLKPWRAYAAIRLWRRGGQERHAAMISTLYQSPVGPLTLISNGAALVHLQFENPRYPYAPAPEGSDAILDLARRELDLYFAGKLTVFSVPVAPQGTAFQRRVWAALQAIPYGATRTYGAQAALIDAPKAVRAVGLANGRNPISIIIPCHRVIGAGGALTGYGGGLPRKQFLLELEQGQSVHARKAS